MPLPQTGVGINVTGDWRAIYQPISTDTALFVEIDTHHNLYGT